MELLKTQPALYLASAPMFGGLVRHTGIVDVGNRMGYSNVVPGGEPVVIHLPVSGLKAEFISATKLEWKLEKVLLNEDLARARIAEAWKDGVYRLFDNNCEHFTEFVLSGIRSSPQLQGAAMILVMAMVVGAAVSSSKTS